MPKTSVQNRKLGSATFDSTGNPVELFGMVKVGDQVQWLGRKEGSCLSDVLFKKGESYRVAMIYSSNFNLEIEQYIDGQQVTIRAAESEYKTL